MVAKTKVATTSLAPTFLKYTPLLLAFIAFFLYANTIGNGYNMDDELVTRKHKFTSKGLSAVKDILTNPYYSDDMGYRYGYRPVVHLSFALEHQLFGENPHTSHFFNVLLFALCVYLFFRLLKLWTGEKGLTLAVVATAIFIFHPVHTEVVASIKNRDEILALLFGLLAGIAFFKKTSKPQIAYLIMAAICMGTALLSKKSIYPLVIIFSFISVVLYRNSIKDTLFYAAFLILPGALVVSEFDFFRMVIAVLAPVLIIVLTHYLIHVIQVGWDEVKGKYISRVLDYRVGIVLVSLVLVWSIRFDNVIILLITLSLLLLLAWRSPEIGLPVLIVCLAIVGYFKEQQLGAGMNLVAVIYLFHISSFSLNKETLKRLFVSAIVLGLYFYSDLRDDGIDLSEVVFVGVFLGLLYILRKYRKWGMLFLFLFVVSVGSILASSITVNNGSGIYLLLLLLVLLISELLWKRDSRQPIYMLFGVISILYLSVAMYTSAQQAASDTKFQEAEIVLEEDIEEVTIEKMRFQEGRKLEFAENTLTAPHTFSEKVGTGSVTLGEYLRLMIFPWELSFYYGYAKVETVGLTNPWVWISLLFHLGLIILALWQIKKRPFVAIGIVWYMLCIGLFSNWVELVAGMVGERLAFTASAGFCIFVAAVVVWVKPNLNFKKLGWVEVVLGVVMIAFAFRTITRNTDWKDKLTLMGNDIKHLEHSAQANNLYALSLMQESFENKKLKPEQQFNMRKLAVTHFDKALQIWPEFFNAAYDKGRASILIGDYASAIDGFEKAVAIGPEAGFIDPYMQLSQLYEQTGNYNGYLVNAKKLLQIRNEAETYNMVAKGFYFTGRNDSAKQYLHEGMTLFPDDVSLRKNIAEIFRVELKQDSVDHYLK